MTETMNPLPQLIVFSGPSGVGKSTQIHALRKNDPAREFLVSYTTRMPREEEKEGVHYHFLSVKYLPEGKTPWTATTEEVKAACEKGKAEFDQLFTQGEMFERTAFNHHYYGTPRVQLEQALKARKRLVADVNLDGALAFRQRLGAAPLMVFLSTPEQTLRDRLVAREITSQDLPEETRTRQMGVIDSRMKLAAQSLAEEGAMYDGSPVFNCVIDNSALTPDEAGQKVQAAIAEYRPPTQPDTSVHMVQYLQQRAQARQGLDSVVKLRMGRLLGIFGGK